MEKEKVKEIILNVIQGVHSASLATLKEGKPWVRYVMCAPMGDALSLYCSTSLKSRKIAQLETNPDFHITMGWNEAEQKGPYLQISGKAVIHTDAETKKKCWVPAYEMFFGTPENPDYCIIEFPLESVEVWGYGGDMMSCLTYEK